MPAPLTLTIDVGGTVLKGAILTVGGTVAAARVRHSTPCPCPPPTLVAALVALAGELPAFDRVSVGFPGAIRGGRVLEVPALSRATPAGPADADLAAQWSGYDLGRQLARAFGVPVRVANDADVQGCAAVAGHGMELVLTLGTELGTAVFFEGRLLPHIELSHGPFRKGRSYDDVLGDAGRRLVGTERWRRRVRDAIAAFDAMLLFDHCFVGGGNAKRLKSADLGPKISLIPNIAVILGGIALWNQPAIPHAAIPPPPPVDGSAKRPLLGSRS